MLGTFREYRRQSKLKHRLAPGDANNPDYTSPAKQSDIQNYKEGYRI